MTEAISGKLAPLIDSVMAEWQVPGLAVAVVIEDEPVLVKGFGQRDVEAGLPVTLETQFALCSITKTFTAIGLGLLVDERRLDWTKPVREYIPEFRLYDPVASDRVTVQDLLYHQSGLPRHDWIWIPGDWSQERMFAALRYLEPSKDIRAAFQYCNLGYMVAGMVAERITGRTWEDFTRERILVPLGMRQSGFSLPDLAQAGDAARPYMIADEERRRVPFFPIRTTPAGGITASVSAMVPYLRLLAGGGQFRQLISPAIFAELLFPHIAAGSSEFPELTGSFRGLGFELHRYCGERVAGHGGGWIGWGTLLRILPDRRCAIAILTNRSVSPVTEILTGAIFDAVSGREPIPWFERFKARKRAFLAQRAASRAAHQAARNAAADPTHAFVDYAGRYEHPGYGSIDIEARDGALSWSYRGLSGMLAHRHYDVFEVPEDPTVLCPDNLALTFAYDREGTIDRLSAAFEPMVGEIVFTRAPGGEALDPAFRAACVGTYQGAINHVVALDAEGQLTLSSAGQPTYRLAPYQGRIFAITGLAGFRVEFRRSEASVVDEIIFHQPNGTFTARRMSDSAPG